jgi:predicted nucleic acid-binding protein
MIAARIKPYKAGRLVNALKELAETIGPLPWVERSPDPTDDFLLALSEVGKADFLVTGDKSGLLALIRHNTVRIVSARDFAALLQNLPRRLRSSRA